MPDSIQTHSAYMRHAFLTPRAQVSQAKRILDGVDFDTLVGTGLSGALVIPHVARALKVKWLIVRKKKDASHSTRYAEGELGRRWVFMDDLIDSGTTYRCVREAVKNVVDDHNRYYVAGDDEPFKTELVGTYLYNNYGSPEFWPYRPAPDPVHNFTLPDIEPETGLERLTRVAEQVAPSPFISSFRADQAFLWGSPEKKPADS